MSSFDGVTLAWFHPVTVEGRALHWSARHRCLVRLTEEPPAIGLDGAGPRRIASGTGFVAVEEVAGVSLAALLAVVPARDLHNDVRLLIAHTITQLLVDVARSGWAMPTPHQVMLGFDGRVVVVVDKAARRNFGPSGYPDSSMREARSDAKQDAIDNAAAQITGFLRRHLDVDFEAACWTIEAPLAALLNEVFPQEAAAHAALVKSCATLPPGSDPVGVWDDCLLEPAA